uniref:Uncharacterized protein n=1 Tax=Rhizophora mucronata TaxID=61149 RepID=A0A2P2QXJ0_RHIMU
MASRRRKSEFIMKI